MEITTPQNVKTSISHKNGFTEVKNDSESLWVMVKYYERGVTNIDGNKENRVKSQFVTPGGVGQFTSDDVISIVSGYNNPHEKKSYKEDYSKKGNDSKFMDSGVIIIVAFLLAIGVAAFIFM